MDPRPEPVLVRGRTIQVRRGYGLTIDRAAADAIDQVLAGCASSDMMVLAPGTSPSIPATLQSSP